MKNFIILLIFQLPIFIFAQSKKKNIDRLVDSLIMISRQFTKKEIYDSAHYVNDSGLALVNSRFGKENSLYAKLCFNRGRIYYFQDKYQEAEFWYFQTKSIQENYVGKKNKEYASTLHNLGGLYLAQDSLILAEKYYSAAASYRKKVLGRNNLDYAQTLHNLGMLYYDLLDFKKSINCYTLALNIRLKKLGEKNQDYLYTLNNLALTYLNIGEFSSAELLYLKALEIRIKEFGPDHIETTASMNDLAMLYDESCNYEKAEPLYLKSLEIRRRTLGSKHVQYAFSLNNLGVFYLLTGKYDLSEGYLIEARNIREEINSKNHKDYLQCLSNLGALYVKTNNYKKAIELFIEILQIRESNSTDSRPENAYTLNNLGSAYLKTSNDSLALQCFLKSSQIFEKVFGTEHLSYAKSIIQQAIAYSNLNQYFRSDSLLNSARIIIGNKIGHANLDFVKCNYLIGINALKAGNIHKSDSILIISDSLIINSVGIQHPYYTEYLKSRIKLDFIMNLNNEAEKSILLLNQLSKDLIIKSLTYMTESELENYLNDFKIAQDLASSLLYKHDSKKLIELCLNNQLFYNNLLLRSRLKVNELESTDSLVLSTIQEFKITSRNLAKQYSLPVTQRKGLQELEDKYNTLEKQLIKSNFLTSQRKLFQNWKNLSNKLKPNEIIILYNKFRIQEQREFNDTYYAAFILKSNAELPEFVLLCKDTIFDSLLNSNSTSPEIYQKFIYNDFRNNQNMIYSSFFQPIEKYLIGVNTVWYVPAGNLHKISIPSLRIDRNGMLLGEKYKMVLINDFANWNKEHFATNKFTNITIFGDVEYNLDTSKVSKDLITSNFSEITIDSKHSLKNSIEYKTVKSRAIKNNAWEVLQFSEVELNQINNIAKNASIQAQVYQKENASEEIIKSIGSSKNSPRILHFCTHGFFFPTKGDSIKHEDHQFKLSINPMLRSGLILAGANYRWKNGIPYMNMEDGVLTSYEIANMNLKNTELVVLSACETGLGDISDSEGVYGLQRAFKIAGAKNILMSLWNVDDEATSVLMYEFYTNLLIKHSSISESLQLAQQYIRTQTKFRDPYFWAGWVLLEE